MIYDIIPIDVIWNPTKTNTSPIQEVCAKCIHVASTFLAHVEKAIRVKANLVGGFKYFLFSPLPGEDS